MEMVADIPLPAVPMSVKVDCVPAEKLHDNSAEKGAEHQAYQTSLETVSCCFH